jgi:glycosyltransferase involved in cell wall biosynthesis
MQSLTGRVKAEKKPQYRSAEARVSGQLPQQLQAVSSDQTSSFKSTPFAPHVLCIGGEDHELRLPFLLALRQHGFQVSTAGTGDPGPFSRAGFDYHPFRFDRFVAPAADWAAIKRLSKLIADLRPAIIHCFDTKPNFMVPLAARQVPGVRVVRTINGMGWTYSSRSPAALALRPVYQALHRYAARTTAATVFQNREDQDFFQRHRMTGGSSCRLIPGSGIDIERFDRERHAGLSSAQLRDSLGLAGCEVVITVTRLTRQKGIPTLLKAAALVHKERPGVRFLLVGPRQTEGSFAVPQAEIDRHAPYVMAIGRRTDVPALLRLADVFAFPTEYREGVPRSLLEAALAELPIVTTNMPGCRDVVRHGWSGLLVSPRSPRALAAGILDLLRDRRAAVAMGARAAAVVRREFSLETVAARYIEVYSELLGQMPDPQWFHRGVEVMRVNAVPS